MKEIEAENHDVIVLNFANPDMVGHSGKLEPTIRAVEAVDECLGRVVEAVQAGGVAVITADHGNADMVIERERGRTRPTPSTRCPSSSTERKGKLAGGRHSGGYRSDAPATAGLRSRRR